MILKKHGEKKPLNDLTIKDLAGPLTANLWEVHPTLPYREVHPATFPLTIPTRIIRLFSCPNDIVLDPFSGSGTTGEAAQKLNRRYINIDINPDFCKIARNRLRQGELF